MIREHQIIMNKENPALMIQAGITKYLRDFQIIVHPEGPSTRGIDFIFSLESPDKTSNRAAVIINQNLRPSTLALVKSRFDKAQTAHNMIITSYITPPLAEKLREMKIWFLDEAGNIYVDVPGKIFIFDAGYKKKSTGKPSPLITAANAKIFFFLLKNGPKAAGTYRQMAAHTGVSLGKISQSIGDLKQRELIHVQKDGILIRDPVKLLELWVQAYLEKLKPQLYIGTYTWPYENDFSHMDSYGTRFNEEIGIGGELGGERLTGYLKPASMDLWVKEDYFPQLKKILMLMDSVNGGIRVYAPFEAGIFTHDSSDNGMRVKVVHPLIVYADLMGINDSRCHETAEMVKDKHLEWIK